MYLYILENYRNKKNTLIAYTFVSTYIITTG